MSQETCLAKSRTTFEEKVEGQDPQHQFEGWGLLFYEVLSMVKVYRVRIMAALAIMCLIALREPSWAEDRFPLSIKDGCGNLVRLAHAPRRILSLVPSITEVIFSLGLGDRVVGVTSNCNYPVEARSKPKVGDIHLNLEAIISLKPDLIIAEATLKQEGVNRLRSMLYPILEIKSGDLADFRESFLLVGRATGTHGKASSLLQALDRRMQRVTSRVRSLGERRPRVFVEIWDRPLMTASGQTFIAELLDLAGGENIATDLSGDYPVIGTEMVIVRNPEVIVLTTSRREDIMQKAAWQKVDAVKNGRVYNINPDLLVRPTLRMAEALESLAAWFYPEIK